MSTLVNKCKSLLARFGKGTWVFTNPADNIGYLSVTFSDKRFAKETRAAEREFSIVHGPVPLKINLDLAVHIYYI